MIAPIVVEPVVVPVPLTIEIAIEVEHAADATRVAENITEEIHIGDSPLLEQFLEHALCSARFPVQPQTHKYGYAV